MYLVVTVFIYYEAQKKRSSHVYTIHGVSTSVMDIHRASTRFFASC